MKILLSYAIALWIALSMKNGYCQVDILWTKTLNYGSSVISDVVDERFIVVSGTQGYLHVKCISIDGDDIWNRDIQTFPNFNYPGDISVCYNGISCYISYNSSYSNQTVGKVLRLDNLGIQQWEREYSSQSGSFYIFNNCLSPNNNMIIIASSMVDYLNHRLIVREINEEGVAVNTVELFFGGSSWGKIYNIGNEIVVATNRNFIGYYGSYITLMDINLDITQEVETTYDGIRFIGQQVLRNLDGRIIVYCSTDTSHKGFLIYNSNMALYNYFTIPWCSGCIDYRKVLPALSGIVGFGTCCWQNSPFVPGQGYMSRFTYDNETLWSFITEEDLNNHYYDAVSDGYGGYIVFWNNFQEYILMRTSPDVSKISIPSEVSLSMEIDHPTMDEIQIENLGPFTISIDSIGHSNSGFIFNYDTHAFATPHDSLTINITFSALQQGIYVDALHIWINTEVSNTDDPRHHIIPLVGEAGPIPGPVTDLAIQILPDQSAQLTWSPVTETIYGNPVVPDYYLIYYSEDSPEQDHYFYLTATPGTDFTHFLVARFAPQMFYRIVAYKGINPTLLGIEPGMSWPEVQRRLAREDR